MAVFFVRPMNNTTTETINQNQNQPVNPTSSAQFQEQMEESSSPNADSQLQALQQSRSRFDSFNFHTTQYNMVDYSKGETARLFTTSTDRFNYSDSLWVDDKNNIHSSYSSFINRSIGDLFNMVESAIRGENLGSFGRGLGDITGISEITYDSKYGHPKIITFEQEGYDSIKLELSDFVGAGTPVAPLTFYRPSRF